MEKIIKYTKFDSFKKMVFSKTSKLTFYPFLGILATMIIFWIVVCICKAKGMLNIQYFYFFYNSLYFISNSFVICLNGWYIYWSVKDFVVELRFFSLTWKKLSLRSQEIFITTMISLGIFIVSSVLIAFSTIKIMGNAYAYMYFPLVITKQIRILFELNAVAIANLINLVLIEINNKTKKSYSLDWCESIGYLPDTTIAKILNLNL